MSDGVPFVDLRWQNEQVLPEFHERLPGLLLDGSFVLGPAVEEFEGDFAAYTRSRHCIGVGNGTDAIELALRAAGVGRGDEVIIPVNTFIATAEAVVRAGARPVPVAAGPEYLIDPAAVEAATTPATRAVVAVHLYGQMAPMADLQAAVPDGVLLIEDAAQSQGASQDGRPSGSVGVVAATSFYPGKNLGAFGDAGAVMTDDDEIADTVRALRNHGGTSRYEHRVVGTNSRLDSVQALALTLKLRKLDSWNSLRRTAADRYRNLLAGVVGVRLPEVARGNEHVWHLYVVEVDERERVVAELSAHGIGAGIHYPRPVHRTPAFEHLGRAGEFPDDEHRATRILSLPMFPGITEAQQARVVECLADAVARR